MCLGLSPVWVWDLKIEALTSFGASRRIFFKFEGGVLAKVTVGTFHVPRSNVEEVEG